MNIPPVEKTPDHNAEAKRIALIKEYWASRGYDIEARIISYGFNSTFRASVLGVEFSLVNGWTR